MRFLIDAQLSPQLVGWLRTRGHEAEHVLAVLGAKDRDVAVHAAEQGAIVISKDADFVPLLEGRTQLVWVRVGNASNRTLFAMLDLSWPRIEGELRAGAAVVEVH